MTAKKQSFYIPVTMDELMARFVTNMERNECKTRFKNTKHILFGQNLSDMDQQTIEAGVVDSFTALKDLLSSNTIEMERQPNTENHLYLKLMERAQEENQLKLINMKSSKKYHIVKTAKPKHLK